MIQNGMMYFFNILVLINSLILFLVFIIEYKTRNNKLKIEKYRQIKIPFIISIVLLSIIFFVLISILYTNLDTFEKFYKTNLLLMFYMGFCYFFINRKIIKKLL